MLLALRSLYEPTVTPPIVPPGFGGGGGQVAFRPVIPPRPSIAAEVTLRPARGKFRAGDLTATGGAIVSLLPVNGKLRTGIMTATGAANISIDPVKSRSRTGKVSAIGIENDESIASAIIELL